MKHARAEEMPPLPPISPGYYGPMAGYPPLYGPQLPLGFYGMPCLQPPLPPPPPPPCISQEEREEIYREAYLDCMNMINSVQ